MKVRTLKFNREDLYTKVWITPLTKLALEYGVSANGLKKACIKMNIPVPYNGYWRKIETTKDVFKPPLPLLKPGETDTYEMKIEKKAENDLSDKFRSLIEQEENPDNKIIVKNKYLRDHPLVYKTRQLLINERKDSDGMLRVIMKDALNIAVTPENLARSLRIMNALLYELEKRNFNVKTRMGYHRLPETMLIFDGNDIEIDLREVMKITRVPKKYGSNFITNEYVRKLIPTGILRLEIKNFWDNGTTRIVKDNKEKKLEEQLNFFIICIYRVINYDVRRHAIWEEENRKREELERLEQQRIEEEKKEEERKTNFFKMAYDWNKIENAKRFLVEAEKGFERNHTLTQERKEWLKWAWNTVNNRDPLIQLLSDSSY